MIRRRRANPPISACDTKLSVEGQADIKSARVAIAHDYLTQRGGAEKVVLAMSRALPDAPIHTLLYDPANTYPEFADRDVRVSPLNRVGVLRKNHRAALPLLPLAASAMRVDADIVIISSSGWAHGFRAGGVKLVLSTHRHGGCTCRGRTSARTAAGSTNLPCWYWRNTLSPGMSGPHGHATGISRCLLLSASASPTPMESTPR